MSQEEILLIVFGGLVFFSALPILNVLDLILKELQKQNEIKIDVAAAVNKFKHDIGADRAGTGWDHPDK